MDSSQTLSGSEVSAGVRRRSIEVETRAVYTLQAFFRRKTREWHRKVLRTLQTRNAVQELIIFCLFLAVFTTSSVIVLQDQDIFHTTNNIRGQLTGTEFLQEHTPIRKTFRDVHTVETVYQWMLGPMHRTLYTSGTTYGGNRTSPGYVLGVNRLIGGVRVSQLRVRDRVCEGRPGFSFRDGVGPDTAFDCSGTDDGDFSLDAENREPFGENGHTYTFDSNATAQTVEERRARWMSTIRTKYDKWAPAAAFPVILPHKGKEAARAAIEGLQAGKYIDRFTRFVFVDFSLYNAMLNVFAVVRIELETPKAGGVLASADFTTVRLYSMFETTVVLYRVLESVVLAFFLYYISVEVRKVYMHGLRHTFALQNMLHILNLLFYVLFWVFRFLSYTNLPDPSTVKADSDIFYAFRYGAMLKAMSLYVSAVNVFLSWFKLVRFLSYVPKLALVTGTLSRAASGVGGFMVVFAVVMYGFGVAHFLTFGTRIFEYRNMTSTMFTLLTSLLGQFNYEALRQAQWLMGPLMFMLFIGVAVFVVLNVLIAIISDAYAAQQEALSQSADVKLGSEIGDFLLTKAECIPWLGRRIKSFNVSRRKHKHTIVQALRLLLARVRKDAAQSLSPVVKRRRLLRSRAHSRKSVVPVVAAVSK